MKVARECPSFGEYKFKGGEVKKCRIPNEPGLAKPAFGQRFFRGGSAISDNQPL